MLRMMANGKPHPQSKERMVWIHATHATLEILRKYENDMPPKIYHKIFIEILYSELGAEFKVEDDAYREARIDWELDNLI